jgi:hypothetical protein
MVFSLQSGVGPVRSARSKKARSRVARRRALGNPCVLLLSRRTGHCRQHALRMMMVMPAMLQRNAHLVQGYL